MDFLKLDPERIDLVVENRWSNFLTQLRNDCQNDAERTSPNAMDVDAVHAQTKNVKVFVSFLTHHQTARKLTVRFNQLEKEAASDRSYRTKQFVLRVYAVFAKNGFGPGVPQEVEKVFVRSFGTVVADEIIPLCVMKKFFDDRDCLEEILSCFSAVVSNPKVCLKYLNPGITVHFFPIAAYPGIIYHGQYVGIPELRQHQKIHRQRR